MLRYVELITEPEYRGTNPLICRFVIVGENEHWNSYDVSKNKFLLQFVLFNILPLRSVLLTSKVLCFAAYHILESLDRTAKPCEDFYQFACGGWIRRNPVPESQSSWDQFRLLREDLLLDLRGRSSFRRRFVFFRFLGIYEFVLENVLL